MRRISAYLILGILSGCGETEVKRDVEPAGAVSNTRHPELIGTWVFDCTLPQIDDPSKNSSYRFTGELEITHDQIIYTQIAHNDDSCKEAVFENKRIDSYIPRGRLSRSETVYKWDWKLISWDQVALDEEIASSFNQETLFEYSNWTAKNPKSILGRKPDSKSEAYASLGTISFMIYKIEDGVGYFKVSDAVNDGESEATRKVGLDNKLKFKKKSSSK